MSDPSTFIPNLCYTCLYEVVHGAGMAESDPWQATVITVQIGLFQAATQDDRVWQRCSPTEDGKRKTEDLSLVLAEIGCLGCFKPKTRDHLAKEIREHGLSEVAQRVQTQPTEDHDSSTPGGEV